MIIRLCQKINRIMVMTYDIKYFSKNSNEKILCNLKHDEKIYLD